MLKKEIKMTWDHDLKGEGIYIDLQILDTENQDLTADSALNIGFAEEKSIALKLANELAKEYDAEVDTQIY